MGYYTFQADHEKWKPRKGLEGPFFYPNGRTLYYDPREGKYWDPQTDFYVDIDEVHALQQEFVNLLRASHPNG